MEKCLLAPHCRERHRATACEKFKSLSLQHRQWIIAEQELCANCLQQEEGLHREGGRASLGRQQCEATRENTKPGDGEGCDAGGAGGGQDKLRLQDGRHGQD